MLLVLQSPFFLACLRVGFSVSLLWGQATLRVAFHFLHELPRSQRASGVGTAPNRPELALPPAELALPQPALTARGSDRHPAPCRLADRFLPISCLLRVTPRTAHPPPPLRLIHARSAHVVSQINYQGITRWGLQPRKMGSPDGNEFFNFADETES